MQYTNKDNPYYYQVRQTFCYGTLESHQRYVRLYEQWENEKKFGKFAP